ncbi:MAG: SMP-30/gluconolactonase/LRE family protein [Burkholderiales bacterium]|nr:SMP-30/gluconolactonase/LRE family protein [Burkholderiales bacterium]
MTTMATDHAIPQCIWHAHAELGEGACWSVRHQALFWVDILGRFLYQYTPATGERREWAFRDTVSAVAERQHGKGLVVLLRRGLAFFDPETGKLDLRHRPEPGRVGNRFNDGKCDARGVFWGGSMDFDGIEPSGALYAFDSQGRGRCAVDLRWQVTNGPTWSLDGRTMYFNNTVQRQVVAFDFNPATGQLSCMRNWLRFNVRDGYPDGMTTDAQGYIWIAHWGGSCVSCHDPVSAVEIARIQLPASQITSVAFGGPDLRTLYVTSARVGLSDAQLDTEPLAGSVFAVETQTTGMPANLFIG